MEKGQTVACDECMRARPIQNPVVTVFGRKIGFGPAGEKDMFIKDGDEITCYWCLDDEMKDMASGIDM